MVDVGQVEAKRKEGDKDILDQNQNARSWILARHETLGLRVGGVPIEMSSAVLLVEFVGNIIVVLEHLTNNCLLFERQCQ